MEHGGHPGVPRKALPTGMSLSFSFLGLLLYLYFCFFPILFFLFFLLVDMFVYLNIACLLALFVGYFRVVMYFCLCLCVSAFVRMFL